MEAARRRSGATTFCGALQPNGVCAAAGALTRAGRKVGGVDDALVLQACQLRAGGGARAPLALVVAAAAAQLTHVQQAAQVVVASDEQQVWVDGVGVHALDLRTQGGARTGEQRWAGGAKQRADARAKGSCPAAGHAAAALGASPWCPSSAGPRWRRGPAGEGPAGAATRCCPLLPPRPLRGGGGGGGARVRPRPPNSRCSAPWGVRLLARLPPCAPITSIPIIVTQRPAACNRRIHRAERDDARTGACRLPHPAMQPGLLTRILGLDRLPARGVGGVQRGGRPCLNVKHLRAPSGWQGRVCITRQQPRQARTPSPPARRSPSTPP